MNRSARLLLSSLAAVICTAAVVESGPAHAAPPPADTATTTYTVRPGYSLVGISNGLGIGVSVLLRANDLTLASVIYPGDVLTVPASTEGATRPATTAVSAGTS